MNNNSVILRDDAEIPFFASYLVLVPLSQVGIYTITKICLYNFNLLNPTFI